MLRRGAKRARDRCQPGYRTRSVQRLQRKVREMGVRIELRVSKRERNAIVPVPRTIMQGPTNLKSPCELIRSRTSGSLPLYGDPQRSRLTANPAFVVRRPVVLCHLPGMLAALSDSGGCS